MSVTTTTQRAIVQHAYGTVDVLQLETIAIPGIAADDDVLIRVHAAGLDRGTWHLMTGRPYLMRILGFGFRKPKNPAAGHRRRRHRRRRRLRGHHASPSATRCSASAAEPSPSTPLPARTSSPANRQT